MHYVISSISFYGFLRNYFLRNDVDYPGQYKHRYQNGQLIRGHFVINEILPKVKSVNRKTKTN